MYSNVLESNLKIKRKIAVINLLMRYLLSKHLKHYNKLMTVLTY